MVKVYVDLTEFMKIEAITGIQRVVREIVFRFIKDKKIDTKLISYSEKHDFFRIIDNNRFLRYFESGTGSRNTVYSNVYINIEDIPPGAVFFDIDVAWSATLKRSFLLPRLKKQGVLIVAQIYDIMAITHYQYFTSHFSYTFMEYIGAHLLYSNLIIVSTNASLKILEEFARKVGIEKINCVVAYLGADFQRNDDNGCVRNEIKNIAENRKNILMVGTIEPRKNHKLVLDAFDKGLDALGYNIIFAGRVGWKNETFLKQMHMHPCFRKRIYHITDASNAEIDYLYQHAKVVAFPTHMEGFGLPLVEALEHGVPVVATNLDVLKEIGKDYCYYFSDNDIESFVNCIKSIEENAKLFISKCRRLQRYHPVSWDESAEIMLEAIMKIVESAGR